MVTHAPSVQLIYQTSDVVFGEGEGCLIAVWKGPATSAAAERWGEALLDLVDRRPGKCAYVSVILANAPTPPQDVRRSMAKVMSKVEAKLSCLVMVVEGNMIRSSLVRAVLAGMTMLTPRIQPTKICREYQEALAWVRSKIGATEIDFEERLSSSVEHLRQLILAPGVT
jgi:hypothetical protein